MKKGFTLVEMLVVLGIICVLALIITPAIISYRNKANNEYNDKLKDNKSVSKYVSGSDTRNYFYFDQVNDLDIGDTTWINIGSNKVSLDASKLMDTVEIDLSKPFDRAITINTDGLTIADLNDYDSKDGEYLAFARFANKGSLYEVMIYDIKDETKSAE